MYYGLCRPKLFLPIQRPSLKISKKRTLSMFQAQELPLVTREDLIRQQVQNLQRLGVLVKLLTQQNKLWTQHTLEIIVIFFLTSIFIVCIGWTVFYERLYQALSSLAKSSLSFLSSRSFLITSLHIFLRLYPGKLPLTLKVSNLLDQSLLSILSK